MRYWWVNQNQTYRHEVPGGFLWSPLRRADGAKNHFYDTMTQVQPGDLVFSFCDTDIKAVGVATGAAEPSVKPDFGMVGSNWSEYGWLVQVEFETLDVPLHPKSHMALLEPHLPRKYAPLRANGDGLQGVYLTELSTPFANVLLSLIGTQLDLELDEVQRQSVPASRIESEFKSLRTNPTINETERRQLVNSRLGQGLFKNNVRLNERGCRVTGVQLLHHLRASHIKPWSVSNNEERLHGCNGLLLAPHVDHLFDRGFISFASNGSLIVSSRMEPEVMSAWSLPMKSVVESFNSDQQHFLDYHREHVLMSA
jgi:putative restriction endonuclease